MSEKQKKELPITPTKGISGTELIKKRDELKKLLHEKLNEYKKTQQKLMVLDKEIFSIQEKQNLLNEFLNRKKEAKKEEKK